MRFSCAVFQFSNPIIPFRSLLFIFLILLCHYEFFYSVSNSVIRFRIMLCSFPILLFDCRVLSCSFESYYFLSHFVIHLTSSIMSLWIVSFSFQFYYSLSNYVLPNPGLWLMVPLGPVTNRLHKIQKSMKIHVYWNK